MRWRSLNVSREVVRKNIRATAGIAQIILETFRIMNISIVKISVKLGNFNDKSVYDTQLCCICRCKSSLLFQAAVTHAAEGHHGVYIGHEPLPRLPLHVHGMQTPDANLLKELKML